MTYFLVGINLGILGAIFYYQIQLHRSQRELHYKLKVLENELLYLRASLQGRR